MTDRSPRCVSSFLNFGSSATKSCGRNKEEEQQSVVDEQQAGLLSQSAVVVPDHHPRRVKTTKQSRYHDYQLERKMQQLTNKTRQQLRMVNRPTSPEQRERQVNDIINNYYYAAADDDTRSPSPVQEKDIIIYADAPSSPEQEMNSLEPFQRNSSSFSAPTKQTSFSSLRKNQNFESTSRSNKGLSKQTRSTKQTRIRSSSQPVDLDDDDFSVEEEEEEPIDLDNVSSILSVATAGWSSESDEEKDNRPGTVRLTKDELQQHERNVNRSNEYPYSAWKRREEEEGKKKQVKKVTRQERQEEMQSSKAPAARAITSSPPVGFLKKSPCETKKAEGTTTTTTSTSPATSIKQRLNPIQLLKKSSPTARELLEQERARELREEYQRKQHLLEAREQEQKSVERMNRRALARQNKLEGIRTTTTTTTTTTESSKKAILPLPSKQAQGKMSQETMERLPSSKQAQGKQTNPKKSERLESGKQAQGKHTSQDKSERLESSKQVQRKTSQEKMVVAGSSASSLTESAAEQQSLPRTALGKCFCKGGPPEEEEEKEALLLQPPRQPARRQQQPIKDVYRRELWLSQIKSSSPPPLPTLPKRFLNLSPMVLLEKEEDDCSSNPSENAGGFEVVVLRAE